MHKGRDKEVPHIRRRIADGTDFNEMCVERDRIGEGAKQQIGGYGRSCARLRFSLRMQRRRLRSPPQNREDPVHIRPVINICGSVRHPVPGLQ